MFERVAFTLAEVLITLGIIGVVAAITIPSLITKLENIKNSTILKEDYSILQQVMRRAYDDSAFSELTTTNNMGQMTSWFNTYLLPYMNTAHVCYNTTGCWSPETSKYLNNSNASFAYSGKLGRNSICFVLNNGTNVCIDDHWKNEIATWFGVNISPNVGLAFYVDVNGNKRPNVFGKDIFVLIASEDSFKPAGNDVPESTVKNDCKSRGIGNMCAALVKNNDWKIPDLK